MKMRPQMLGGGQEGGYRAGTENLPGVVGFGVAAELMRARAPTARRRGWPPCATGFSQGCSTRSPIAG